MRPSADRLLSLPPTAAAWSPNSGALDRLPSLLDALRQRPWLATHTGRLADAVMARPSFFAPALPETGSAALTASLLRALAAAHRSADAVRSFMSARTTAGERARSYRA